MRKLQQKLHSSHGAAILYALMFLLIVTIMGTVVLTAALSGSTRSARNVKFQQDYLAVSSAVRLIRKDFEGMKFEGTYKKVISVTSTPGAEGEPPLIQTNTSYQDKSAVLTGGKLLDQAQKVRGTGASSDLWRLYFSTAADETVRTTAVPMTYTLSFPATDGLPAVKGTMSLSTAAGDMFTVVITLYAERDGARSNQMTLTYTPNVVRKAPTSTSISGFTTITTTTNTTTVTWNAPTLEKGGAAA